MKLRFIRFLRESQRTPFDARTPCLSYLRKCTRILIQAVKGFYANECYLRSSLLTFYSLISIVPILVLTFSMAKGFGLDEFLRTQVLETFREQKELLSVALDLSYAFMGNLKSQTVIGLGILFLFFTVFGLFENIEKSINLIWNIKKTRRVARRAINYLAAIILFPILFISSTSITIFINAEITKTFANYELLHSLSHYLLTLLNLLPYGLMSLVFSYVYIFTPNSKIQLAPRLFAGILAGGFFQFWQILYIKFQLHLSNYDFIYGNFAALPLFLIWMQVNFMILLFGAEIAAKIEGDKFFRKKSDEEHFELVSQKKFAFLILYQFVSHFLRGESSLSLERISKELGVSLLEAREIFNLLENAGIIAEIWHKGHLLEQYQLKINPELFSLQAAWNLIDTALLQKKVTLKHSASLKELSLGLEALEENTSLQRYSLREFVEKKTL